MNHRRRLIIGLAFLGYPRARIAAETGSKVNTVKSWLREARNLGYPIPYLNEDLARHGYKGQQRRTTNGT